MSKTKTPKKMPLAERLAVLFIYTNGGHHEYSRYSQRHGGEPSYEMYTYGSLPINPTLTKKARKDIESNGIDWEKTSSARDETMGTFEGTDSDSGTLHYYTTDIVSKSGNTYRFSIDIRYNGLAFIFEEMDELRNSPLLED